ncbi:unnamed protein product [Mytilus coruscus]|uniref:LRAT domain-containing protein n=1 Tax=Mytilus coruscus TaxID=42192 RepID=A0A6J8DHY5_MYTCO|nr:unnamed protein product [Mytilus coruscus]
MAAVVTGAGILFGVGAYHFFKTSNKRVYNIRQLKKGDHVKYKRELYSHHAVVVDVYPENQTYKVIHFTGEKKSGIPAEIKEEVFHFDFDKIILIHYRYGRLNRSETVKRAYRLLKLQDEMRVIYDILTNNCEHFATWCITGEAKSQQVNKVLAPIAPYINFVGSLKRPY